jgi:predicted Co/Zn/Cd cation transporter (cation efflux family)
MAPPDAAHERAVLRGSIAATAVLGALGVAWGIAVGSQAILFDGAYGFVGILVSVVLLRASAVAARPPTARYHYGRAGVTPLAVGVQGFVLLATLAYAAVEAVWVIRAGGSAVTAGWALVYGVVATAGSTVTWRWLHARAGASDLLQAEATAWRVAALRGLGMVVGFSILAVLERSDRWDHLAPYVDPVMVLVTCAAFLPGPLRLVRTMVVELLEGAPSAEVQAAVAAAVDEVWATAGLPEPQVRSTKVGPRLYVEVEGRAAPDLTVAEEHAVRSRLDAALGALPYDVWLNLELLPDAGVSRP